MTQHQPACCQKSSLEIKNWVRKKLNLSSNEAIFVSVCGSCEETALTLVMVIDEEGGKDRFQFYKIKKIPQRVTEIDIFEEKESSCCMDLMVLQYQEGKLALA